MPREVEKMLVRVFTHPVCVTCPMAIRLAQRLVDMYPGLELRVVSLGSQKGREEAKQEGILSVPTIIVGKTRFVGVPEWEALVAAVERERNGDA